MKRQIRRVGLALLCVLVSGCGRVVLYDGLSEQQANEVTAELIAAGIDADKLRSDDKKRWSVRVAQARIPASMEVLRAAGLPRNEYATLGQVFEKKGFVSSPLEEKARYLHGLSQELAHTLSELRGVLVARVHIALPEKDLLSEQAKPSSASVVLVVREASELVDRETDIKAIVKDSIEGLDDVNKVTVKFFTSPAAARQVLEPAAVASTHQAAVFPTTELSLLAFALAGWTTATWQWGRRRRGLKPSSEAWRSDDNER